MECMRIPMEFRAENETPVSRKTGSQYSTNLNSSSRRLISIPALVVVVTVVAGGKPIRWSFLFHHKLPYKKLSNIQVILACGNMQNI